MQSHQHGESTCRFGPVLLADGRTEFRVWAPAHRTLTIETAEGTTYPLQRGADGWHVTVLPLGAGTRYRFRVSADSTELALPDPASRAQSDDVHGYSIVVDPSRFAWRHAAWKGLPWTEAVIYEVHPGLAGGFQGIVARLPELRDLGITAIELMPVAHFPGKRNWGYDGVLPYAPDIDYGSPDDLRQLIDEAHGLGLMVFLDVVYNHFGPDGSYMSVFAPDFFRDDVQTPWGAAIDFRRPEVRAFFTNNAIYWVNEYRLDGLRFDAVHAINDADWLDEMAQAVRRSVGNDRHVHLVLENENNDARHLEPVPHRFDAQWNDDLHHAVHVLLTGEREAYYEDYVDRPAERLARALGEGFVYQGEASRHAGGKPRGTPSVHLPTTAFVNCLQNHDQIGNRAFGERLTTLAKPEALRAAIALLLLSPGIPMLFMGEETGSRSPFLFFTDHHDELAPLVREGRRNEFKHFAAFADAVTRERIPDPNDPKTYEMSRPREGPDAHVWRAHYRSLLDVRRTRLTPHLHGCQSLDARAIGPAAVFAEWALGNGARYLLVANLGDQPVAFEAPDDATLIYGSAFQGNVLPPCSTNAYVISPIRDDLRELADELGLKVEWEDFRGRRKILAADSLIRVAEAMGYPCRSSEESAGALRASRKHSPAPSFYVGKVGEPIRIPMERPTLLRTLQARVRLENGQTFVTTACPAPGGSGALVIPAIDEPGYHQLILDHPTEAAAITVALAPDRAYELSPPASWGTAVQVYSLRKESGRRTSDAGVGDYTALTHFVRASAQAGAQALAISPTHAGFFSDPRRASPYMPSSRLLANVLLIDAAEPFGVDAAIEAARLAGIEAELDALERAELIDWQHVGDVKRRWLWALFETHAPQVPDGSVIMRRHASFETLHRHFLEQGLTDWHQWPAPFRDPDSAQVRAFMIGHDAEIRFHLWLLNLAETALERARSTAREAGMHIGLISDLAVGMAPDGSHAWAHPGDLLSGLEVGAPPDLLNTKGQSWGLTTFDPRSFARNGYAPFIETLRSAMRHAGGVRIDHILGLSRLWVVPDGCEASKGAYLTYPLDDLLNLIVLESHRHRTIVIGEDLGTVPPGFRDILAQRGILGMSVLWFERQADGGFVSPDDWRPATAAMTTTHDLPTVAGWWSAQDIAWRERLHPEEDAQAARAARDNEKAALLASARAFDPDGFAAGTEAGCVDVAIDLVAAASATLAIIPVEDLLGVREQPNLPTTIDEHPNWRRRMQASADRLMADPIVARRTARLSRMRPGTRTTGR